MSDPESNKKDGPLSNSVYRPTRKERKLINELCAGKNWSDIALSINLSKRKLDIFALRLREKSGARTIIHLVGLYFKNSWITYEPPPYDGYDYDDDEYDYW